MKEAPKDIQKDITDRFIKQLEQGTVPWRRPWLSAQNIITQKAYQGINTLLLGGSSFGSPWWMTFKQARDLGGSVMKGAKAIPIVYFKFLGKVDHAGNPVLNKRGEQVHIPLVRWSMVFNLEQTQGVKAPKMAVQTKPAEPIVAAAAIVEKMKGCLCPIRHTGFSANYSPTQDVIRMPPQKLFHTPEDYYHTLYHEATHYAALRIMPRCSFSYRGSVGFMRSIIR